MQYNYSLRVRNGNPPLKSPKEPADEFEKFRNKPISGVYGPIENLKVGQTWNNKKELREAGVHLSPSDVHCGPEGVYSLLLTQNVTQDLGYKVRYVGYHSYTRPNSPSSENLVHSMSQNLYSKLTIRVFRSHQLHSKFAPLEGIRYDGLYYLLNCSCYEQNTCYKVTFTLKRVKGQSPAIWDSGPNHKILMQKFEPSPPIAWLCDMFEALRNKFSLTLLGGSVLEHPFSDRTDGIIVCTFKCKTENNEKSFFPIIDLRNIILKHFRGADLGFDTHFNSKDVRLFEVGNGSRLIARADEVCDYQLSFPLSVGNLNIVRSEVVSYFDSISWTGDEMSKSSEDGNKDQARLNMKDSSSKNHDDQPSVPFPNEQEVAAPSPHAPLLMVSSPRPLPEDDLGASEVCKEEVFTKEELNASPLKEVTSQSPAASSEDNKDTVWTPKEGGTVCISDWPATKLVKHLRENPNPTCCCSDCNGQIPEVIKSFISMVVEKKITVNENPSCGLEAAKEQDSVVQETAIRNEPSSGTSRTQTPPPTSKSPTNETSQPEDVEAFDSGDSDSDPLELRRRLGIISTKVLDTVLESQENPSHDTGSTPVPEAPPPRTSGSQENGTQDPKTPSSLDHEPPSTPVFYDNISEDSGTTSRLDSPFSEGSLLSNPPPLFFHQISVRQRDLNIFLTTRKRSADPLQSIETLLEDITKRSRTLSS